MINKNLLRILFLEDMPSDADLAVLELRKQGLHFEYIRVDTRDEFIKALKEFRPAIVVSDYMLPSYNGMLALVDVREFDPLMPFILCTGSMNEETAVECIKAGATDYVIKEHMTRLPFAVKEALTQHHMQLEQRAAEQMLKESEKKLQSIFSAAPVGIGLVVGSAFIEVNDTLCKITGYSRNELLSIKAEALYAKDEQNESAGIVIFRHIAEKGSGSVETRFKRKDGRILNIFLSSIPLDKNDLTKGVTFIAMDITERVQAEEALANEKYLIYSLMSSLHDHIYFKDRHSRFIRINKSQAEFLGLNDPKQAVGKTDADFFTREHADQAYEDEQQIIRTGQSISIEEKETNPNRPDTWASTVKMPLQDKEGNIIGTFGISRDITERKLAEEALQKSQHLFETLAQVSPVGIFRTDPDGNMTYVNPKWKELSGLSSKEAFGEGWLNAVHPEDRGKLSESWVDNLKSENESSAEYRFLRSDGSIRWVIGKAVPELIDNEVAGYIGTITDITERKQVEVELKKNQTQLINALKIAHLGSWEYDVNNEIFIFNDLFYAILRTTAEQAGGYTMTAEDYSNRFIHPDDRDKVGIEIRKAIETDDPNFNTQLEHRIIYADGETGYITVRSFIVKDERGENIRIYGINQDITDRKKVEIDLSEAAIQMKMAKEKAEASDKLKTTFLNNISHEVRTPLNGILGFAEIMSQPDLSEEDKKESFSMLFESSDRLLNTITNYMDISLLTSGTMSLYKKDFSPGQVLREIFSKNKMLCSHKNINFSLNIPEQTEEISICSDPEILRKIISHLLNNAIKFTEKGSIEYGYSINGNELEFFVKDTGIGIGEGSLKDVFEHFVKEDRGPLKITEGSGLGLSISKGFVELLGGKIRVDSEKGKGSAFYFTLPVEGGFQNHPKSPAAGKQKKKARTNSILVAEDDETNFYYLKTLLKQITSANIIHVYNGLEAIEKLKENQEIDLVLMDLKMPVMDGYAAIKIIRESKPGLPIIAQTAYVDDIAKVLEIGCNGFLSKPFDKNKLSGVIKKFINIY